MTKKLACMATALVAFSAAQANAGIVITEWAYSAANGEYIELTNTGASAVDLTGWSYDDDGRVVGSTDLSTLGLVNPGQSVILTESTAAAFQTAWNLTGVAVLGGVIDNLGRNDEINVWDNNGVLVDRLTFGDQTFAGSIRTQNKSGNPISAAALGANNPFQWQLSFIGDGYGTYASTGGDLGNPGINTVPEPATLALLAIGGIAMIRRRK
ncbi:MAG: lamin tail domain-containing protein [Planctomycetes bacterium]|nr:lamin tail domain-containing protein [Planctomycetota bacterium]